jgi:hypothetical protein
LEIVNGYVCLSPAEVSIARRFTDPKRPDDGPFGIYRVEDDAPPPPAPEAPQVFTFGPAVTLADSLTVFAQAIETVKPRPQAYAPGANLSIRA